jgi:hypothetical protein
MGAGRWGAARPPISGYYQKILKDFLIFSLAFRTLPDSSYRTPQKTK